MKRRIHTSEEQFRKKVRKKTWVSFVVFFICIVAGFLFYKWIVTLPRDDRAYAPLRIAMDMNAKIFARSFSEDPSLTKEFPKSIAAKRARVNGNYGLQSELDPEKWLLKVVRQTNATPQPADTIYLTLEDIISLPKTEVVFDFKCIEGWSQVTWWGGVRFSEFAKKYQIGTRDNTAPDTKNHPENILRYCGLETPDGGYYVGVDMPSMMHPQTILCYELNGKPLPVNQGAPLRLIIPVKYGIKHIKRIGTIFFSDQQPRDYWAIRGYDYFAGL